MESITRALLIVQIYCSFCDGLNDVDGYFSWSHGNRTELYCPDTCLSVNHPDKCCSCDGRRCWDVIPANCTLEDAQLEYSDIFGNTFIITSINSSFLKLEHINGRLTRLPENLCTFSEQLVYVDLRGNRLTDVSSIRCLHKLDTLRLDYNQITEIDNTTFTKMKDLRVLSLRNNPIKSLGPNVIKLEYGDAILNVDLSDNKEIEIVDISNIVHAGPFCEVSYKNSSLETISNELNYTVVEHHGPGDISLESTNIGSFINFSTIGVNDYAELGHYFSGTIAVDETSIQCDCSIYPMLSSTIDQVILDLWPNLSSGFICENPESMKGKDLRVAYDEGNFDDLTCNIGENPDCPSYYCHCIEQPSQNKITVNCSAVGFKSLPPTMPIGSWGLNKIDLILAKNDIQKIENRDYLSRLVNLDLSGNIITEFDENAARELTATVNIEDQRLQTLPLALTNKDPNDYTFGENPVLCDCSNIWIGDWIRFRNGYDRLNCEVLDFVSPAENVYSSTLDCNTYSKLSRAELTAIIASIIATLIMLMIVIRICFYFRFELFLIQRRLRKKQYMENPHTEMHDVFISFYTENQEVFKSVRRYLRPTLIKSGYSVFIPCFDIILGEVDKETIEAVHKSKNFVIVMCDNYANDFESNVEFESIWTNFTNDNSKFVIVINYDNLNSASVKDRRLRALKRTEPCLDFSETNSRLISRLVKLMGPPRKKAEQCDVRDGDTDNEKDDVDKTDDKKYVTSRKYEASESYDKSMNSRYETPDVFNRLARPKSGLCNCQYRVCYLHDDAFGPRKIIP
ncbi:hypothetical protein ACF0H5_017460 [Mactra antiquata]